MAERNGRVVGYIAAVVVGLGVGGLFGFSAFVAGLCQTWGEQCTPAETAEMARLWNMAFAAPVVIVGLWSLFDLVVLARLPRKPDPRDSDNDHSDNDQSP